MKHYKVIFYAMFLLFFQLASAQKYAYKNAEVYLLKNDFSSAKDIQQASYLLQIIKSNDTTYVCRYYNKFGPMLKQETFFDSNLITPHGLFIWYDAKGNADSMAFVYTGKKTRYTYFDDNLKRKLFVLFKNGRFFEKRDYLLNIYTDSIGNTTNLADKEKEDHDKFVADSIAGETREASFGSDGSKEWRKYLNKHLLVPDRFTQVMPVGNYEVIVSFLVTKAGTLDEVCLLRSCEWSVDLEVFEIFKNSPPWQPAILNGKEVIYRQKQRLTFSVDEN